jgi:Na+/H+ antiporter NhaA
MATDIAFALGALAILAPGAPRQLRLFLLTLAIVDDIGAILVIAVVYSGATELGWLLVAGLALLAVHGLGKLGVTSTPVFVGIGAVLWLGLQQAGVHPTLAGAAMGLLVPASPRLARRIVRSPTDDLPDVTSPTATRSTGRLRRETVSPLERLEHGLHPWSSLLIVPVFALANAGIGLDRDSLADALASPVALGIVAGLVLGKVAGITGGAWLACRLGLAERPPELGWRDIAGVSAVGGIGFTVSLLIGELAFSDQALVDAGKLGILAAAVLAVAVGAVVLRAGRGRPDPFLEGAPTSGPAAPAAPRPRR